MKIALAKYITALAFAASGEADKKEESSVGNDLPRSIIVEGNAERTIKPTIALWSGSFKVITTNAETITSEMDKARQQVIAFLEKYKIEQSAVQFQPAQVVPIYDNKGNKVERFEAVQSFQVQGDDIDKITTLAHDSFNLFSKDIQFRPDDVNYDIKNTNGIQQELLAEAIKNAREKAKALAVADDQKLGKTLKVEELPSRQSPRPMFAMRAGLNPASTEGVSKTLSATVKATFSIE